MTWRDEDVWGLEEEILEEYYMKYKEVGQATNLRI